MAKWYRSIRVVTTDEPLGTWLSRRGLPVLKGKPRNRRAAGGANGGAGAGAVDEQPGKSAAAAAGRGPKGAAAANTSSATGTKQAGPSSAGDRTGPQASGGIGGAAAAAAESADKLDAEAAVAAAKPPTPTPRSSGAAVAVATGTAEAAGASFVGAETRPGPRSRYITRGAAATAVGVAALSPTPLRSAGDVSGPAAGETLTAAAAAGPAAAAAAKKNGCEPPGDLGGSGGPCWSGRPGLPQSICPGPTVYDNDNAVRRTRLIQQRGSTSTSSPVSLEELRQISGTSYGKVPVAAPAAAAPAPAAAAAAAASAIVVTAAAGSEGAMPAAAVLAPALMPSGTNGESGHGDDSGGVGGNDAAGGGGTVGPGAGTVGPDVGGLAPPDSQISSDVRDASWLRWAWSGYGDGQEGSSPAPPAPAAAGCCLVGLRPGLPALSANTRPAPQQLHASLPGAIDTQLPYRVSAGAAAAASLAGGLPDEALASAGRLPPDARLQGPAAAADSAAIPPQPQPHHPFPPPQSDYGPLLPLFDQPLYGRDSAPWSSAAPPPDASEHALSYDGGSAGSGAGGCHGWPLHQQQQCALGPSPERPGPLLGLGAPSAAAVTSPRGLRPNRIELVKLELLRGARGGGGAAAAGAAAAATAPGAQVHDLLQQPGGAILLGRSLSSSFEARVEHLLRGGGGGGGSAATAAAARPVGWSLGQVAGAAAATGVGTAAGGASGDLEGDRLAFSLSGVGAAATATAWSLDGHGQGWGQMYGHEAMSYDASAVQKLAPGFQQAQAVGLLACSRVTAPEALSWRRPMGHSHPF
ncbi:hypothetical protein PLESTB_000573400 [Pleodorina starrii]|uniref:Uncharacterized protein n=1 Tax=Pleodorina starrii TaxID=330485 RepID=A0A9W6F0E1_9CHLO|nr:hypothetical protein PLESTB_000573400 [Pleodorina starrii]